MSPVRQLISIIIPCFNEEANVGPLLEALANAVDSLPERFEFIFVDDGSRDHTVAELHALSEVDGRVRVIELVRNFSKEIAVTAGYHRSRGAAVICLDADLQHPPTLIPKLITKWREGAEVVVGVRSRSTHHTSRVHLLASHIYYKLVNMITEVQIVARATDYRLVDRSVVNEFNRFTEHHRMTRGLIDWLGFRRAYVEFTPDKRRRGETAYGYVRLINLAVNSVVSLSLFPLKLAGYVGAIIMLVSGPIGLFIFVESYIMNDPMHFHFSGPAILGVLLLFLVGIILVSLGLMALYIATIHTEVMNRPLYVARRELNRRSWADTEEGHGALVDEEEWDNN